MSAPGCRSPGAPRSWPASARSRSPGSRVMALNDDTGRAPEADGGCNGSPKLCERTIDTVTFPATHNSMAAAEYPGWLFPMHDRDDPRAARRRDPGAAHRRLLRLPGTARVHGLRARAEQAASRPSKSNSAPTSSPPPTASARRSPSRPASRSSTCATASASWARSTSSTPSGRSTPSSTRTRTRC